jgi:TnpA family transposase
VYAADNAAAAINKRSRLDQTASPVKQKSSASEPRHAGVAAVQLAYQRFPGRVVGIDETPPADVLSFIAGQLSIEPGDTLYLNGRIGFHKFQ